MTGIGTFPASLESSSFSSICERRRPFRLLLQAYSAGDSLVATTGENQSSGLTPLAPSPSDTQGRATSEGRTTVEEIADGVEGEEAAMQFELSHERREVSLLRLTMLLEVLHPPVVGLDRLAEDDVLELGGLLVELEGADAVEALEVKVAAPPDADAVQDHR